MVVLDYQDFKATYPKADKRTAFLQQYNERHPDQTITKRQLNHWETLYNREGVAGLVDRRGGYNKGTSTIPEDVKQVFLAYWMREKGNRRGGGGPSIASCYRLTQLRAYPKISRAPIAPHIFRHTALIFLAGRQPAREKSPCLAENLRRDWRTANFGISS